MHCQNRLIGLLKNSTSQDFSHEAVVGIHNYNMETLGSCFNFSKYNRFLSSIDFSIVSVKLATLENLLKPQAIKIE